MPDDPKDLRSQIREILINDWDPTNAARSEAAHHTYDTYIPPLADLIRSGADEAALVAFLKDRESEIMCFPAVGSSHLNRVARKLCTLAPHPETPGLR